MKRIATAIVEHGRATEWLTSLVLLGFAFTLSLPGDTFGPDSYIGFRILGLEEGSVSFVITCVAMARLSALYINGRWKRSPLLRFAGGLLGAIIFAMLSMLFLFPDLVALAYGREAIFGTAPATYFVLALFDVLAAYRSMADYKTLRGAVHVAH